MSVYLEIALYLSVPKFHSVRGKTAREACEKMNIILSKYDREIREMTKRKITQVTPNEDGKQLHRDLQRMVGVHLSHKAATLERSAFLVEPVDEDVPEYEPHEMDLCFWEPKGAKNTLRIKGTSRRARFFILFLDEDGGISKETSSYRSGIRVIPEGDPRTDIFPFPTDSDRALSMSINDERFKERKKSLLSQLEEYHAGLNNQREFDMYPMKDYRENSYFGGQTRREVMESFYDLSKVQLSDSFYSKPYFDRIFPYQPMIRKHGEEIVCGAFKWPAAGSVVDVWVSRYVTHNPEGLPCYKKILPDLEVIRDVAKVLSM